jgi:hypothetical protein
VDICGLSNGRTFDGGPELLRRRFELAPIDHLQQPERTNVFRQCWLLLPRFDLIQNRRYSL